MQRQALASTIRDLFTKFEIQVLYIVTVLGKGGQGVITDGLTSSEAELT